MRRLDLEAKISHDLRIFARYQEHLARWRDLQREADAARAASSTRAAMLDVLAQEELALALALRPFFRAANVNFGDARGGITYDRAYVQAQSEARDAPLRTLRPEETSERARRAHVRTWSLAAVVAVFVVSLLFLTLAELAAPIAASGQGAAHERTSVISPGRAWGWFAAAGGTVAVAGIVLWGGVEVLLR